MSKEEDDDESTNITLSRFPCMPSLVALQQMRNRLHMAYVGKKLMKWTAQATGRELRKIAYEFSKTCHHFREEMREGYILLARARYFYPNLNNMVLEHVAKKSEITIDLKMKSLTGVRIIRMEIVDSNEDSYPHLGIEKGGEAIKEAKHAWKHVLKRIIHMIEHRTSFQQVDEANKGATKKRNVIDKVIIPRTKRTIKFILDEIEELEREDTYRLKMFKKLKESRLRKNAQVTCTCPSPYAAEGEYDDTVCFVCKMRFKNTHDNKLYIEHILSHIEDMATLTKHYKLDESVPSEMDRFVKSCAEIKGYIEEFARDPFLCNICKIHDKGHCNATDICKTAPVFDYEERGSPKGSEEPSIGNLQVCQCCDNASPNILIAEPSTPEQEYAGQALLTNDIVELNTYKSATCQYDQTSTHMRPTTISSSSVPSQEITTPSLLLVIDYLKELNISQSTSCQYDKCDSSNQFTTDAPLSRCFYQCEVNILAEARQQNICGREFSASKSATCQYDNRSECSISCQETVQETVQLQDLVTSISSACQCDILSPRKAMSCQENTTSEAENVDFFNREPRTSKPATCQYDNNNIPLSGYEQQCKERVEPSQFDNYIRDFITPRAVICKCDDCDSLCMRPDKTNSEPTSRYYVLNRERNMPKTNDYYKDLGSSNFNFQNNKPLSVYSNAWQQRTGSKNLQMNNNITDNDSLTCHCADRQKSEYSWQEKTTPNNTQMKEYSREYHTFVLESSTTSQCTDKSKEYTITRQASTTLEALKTNSKKNRKFDNFESITCECSNSIHSYIRQTKSSSDIVSRGSCQYHDKPLSKFSNPWQQNTTRKPIQLEYHRDLNDLKSSSCQCSDSVSTYIRPSQSSSEISSSGVFPGQERATPESGPAIDYLRELKSSQSASCQYHVKSISKYSKSCQENTTREPVKIDYLRELKDFKSTSCQCSDSASTNMRLTKSYSEIESRGYNPSQERTTPEMGQALNYLQELNPSQSATCQYHNKSISKYSNSLQQSTTRKPVEIVYLTEFNDLKCTSCQYSGSVSSTMRPTLSSSEIVSSGVFPGQKRATPETGPAIDYLRELNPSQSALCEYHDKSISKYSNSLQQSTTRKPVDIVYLTEFNDLKCTSCQYSGSVSSTMRPTLSSSEIVSSGVFPGQKRATPETGPAIDYLRELNPSESALCQYHDKSLSKYSNPCQGSTTLDPVQIYNLSELNDLKSISCQCSGLSTKSHIVSSGVFPGQDRTTSETGPAIDYLRELDPSESVTFQYHAKSISKYSKPNQESTTRKPVEIEYLRKLKESKSISCQCRDSVSTNMFPTKSSSGIVSSVLNQVKSTSGTGPVIDYLREQNPSKSATCQYYDKSVSGYSNPSQEHTAPKLVQIDYIRELNASKSTLLSGSFIPYQDVIAPGGAKSKDYFRECCSTWKSHPCDCDESSSINFRPTKESGPFMIASRTSNKSGPYYETKSVPNFSYIFNRVGKPLGEETERTNTMKGPYYETKAIRNYSYIYNRSGKPIGEEIEQPKTSNKSGPYYETKSVPNFSYIFNRVGKPLCEKTEPPNTMKGPYYETKVIRNYSYIYNRSGKPIGEEIEQPKTSNKSGPYYETKSVPNFSYIFNRVGKPLGEETEQPNTMKGPYYETKAIRNYSYIYNRSGKPIGEEIEQPKTSNKSGPYYETKSVPNFSYIFNRVGKPLGEETEQPNTMKGPYYETKAIRNYSYIYNRSGKPIGEEIEQPKTSNKSGPYYETKSVPNFSYIFNRVGKPLGEQSERPNTMKGPYYETKAIRNYSYIYNRIGKPIGEEIEQPKTSNNYDSMRGPYYEIKIIPNSSYIFDHVAKPLAEDIDYQQLQKYYQPKIVTKLSYIFDRVKKPVGVEQHVSRSTVCKTKVLPEVAASTTMNIPPSTCKTGICSKVTSSKSVNLSLREKTHGTCKPADEKSLSLNVDDNSLGFFEKQTKEIVRVTRGVDDDGAMVEEKQFITIRTEKRAASKYAKFNTDITNDLKEFNIVECSSNKVPATREAKSQNSILCHLVESPIIKPCTSKNNTICQNNKDTIPKYTSIFKNSSTDAQKQSSFNKDSTSFKKKSDQSFGCYFKSSSFHSTISEPEKTAKDSFPKTSSINTSICDTKGCQPNKFAMIKPSYDSISKKLRKTSQKKDFNNSLEDPCPCKNEDCIFKKDEKNSCLAISCLSKNTSNDALSQRSFKNTFPCKFKSCPSNNTATNINKTINKVTCMNEKRSSKIDVTSSYSYCAKCGLSQNTSTDIMLEKPSGNTLDNKYKNSLYKNAATCYDEIRKITEKTSTDTLLLKSSVNKLPGKNSCPFCNMPTTSIDKAGLPPQKTSMDKLDEKSTKHPIKHICSNCKQKLITEPEPAKDHPHANFVLVPYARTLGTQTGYKEVWVDATIMKKTSRSSAVHNCNTKASSPIWTEVETPKSNASIIYSGKSNFKSIPSIFGDKTTEYDDDEIKVIIKIIPKTKARMTCSAGTIHPKPSLEKTGNLPQDEKLSTLSCPVQTQSCRLVKIKNPPDSCDCMESKPDWLSPITKPVSCKTGQFSGSTKSPASSYASCRSSTIGTCKSTSSQPTCKTNSEEELFACTFQKNKSNKSSCTGTSIYSAKVPTPYRASRTTLRSGGSIPLANASTLTKRSDRFDLRTLRQLHMNRNSSKHSHKKINFTLCPCHSDPHFNKVKAKRPVKRCYSSPDGDYYNRRC